MPIATVRIAPVEPIYVFLGNDETGAARTEYRCPLCGMSGPRRKPTVSHLESRRCSVLKAEDEKKHQDNRAYMKRMRDQGYDDTWVWSEEKLEELRALARRAQQRES